MLIDKLYQAAHLCGSICIRHVSPLVNLGFFRRVVTRLYPSILTMCRYVAIAVVLTVAALVFPSRGVCSAVQPMTDAIRLPRARVGLSSSEYA